MKKLIEMVELVPLMHKDFNGFYYKIINSNFGNPYYIMYNRGTNALPLKVLESEDGIYFTDIKHIFAYLNYGPILAEMIIPKDAIIHYMPEQMHMYGESIPAWNTNKVFIRKYYDINNINTIEYLIESGSDITVDDFYIFKYALAHNIGLWNYLVTRYYDIIQANTDTIFI